jgi:hypothetical protein
MGFLQIGKYAHGSLLPLSVSCRQPPPRAFSATLAGPGGENKRQAAARGGLASGTFSLAAHGGTATIFFVSPLPYARRGFAAKETCPRAISARNSHYKQRRFPGPSGETVRLIVRAEGRKGGNAPCEDGARRKATMSGFGTSSGTTRVGHPVIVCPDTASGPKSGSTGQGRGSPTLASGQLGAGFSSLYPRIRALPAQLRV